MVDSIYIGLMTGTSADSLDCAAVNFSKKEMNIIGLKNYDIPNALKQKIQESSQALELNESLIKDLDIKLGNFFSESIKDLIKTLSLDKNQVSGIGSHGQTIKHEPNAENPYSMQIGDPQLISNNLGIKTVGRFRDDDILAGGQGAPISPVFHREVFAQTGEKRLIVNIGGITNISVISDQEIMGFDTGPGNCLMDTWCRKNLKGDFDDEGNEGRIADSIELAFNEGHGICSILEPGEGTLQVFNKKFENRGVEFQEPSLHFFAFNNPYGACKTCEGYGKILGIDQNLVIPNHDLSVSYGCSRDTIPANDISTHISMVS